MIVNDKLKDTTNWTPPSDAYTPTNALNNRQVLLRLNYLWVKD